MLLLFIVTDVSATVDSGIARNDYTGNGTTMVYPYTFRILNANEIRISVNAIVKVLNTDYSVSNVGAQGGGNITFVVAPPNTQPIIFSRNMQFTQTTDYIPNQAINTNTLERNLDKLTMITQQLNELIQNPGFTPSPPSGSPILQTIIDAKGDLIVGTGPDAVSRLAVGVNNATIVADSTQATGIKWSIPSTVLVTDAGAVCDGVVDDKVAIQALIDSVADGSEIQFPPAKRCRITGELTITKGLTIHGITRPSIGDIESNNPVGSTIVLDSTASNAISINTTKTVMIRNIGIRGQTTATAGALVKITGGSYIGALFGSQGTVIENSTFYGGDLQIQLESAIFPRIERNILWNAKSVGILIRNTGDNDQGDQSIANNTISLQSTGVGVRFESGGGVKLINNKILSGIYSVVVDRIGTVATSDFLITGNSLEGFSSAAIFLTRTSGSLGFANIPITGNQIASATNGVFGINTSLAATFGGITISGNTFSLIGGGVTTCLGIDFLFGVVISSNYFGCTQGVVTGANTTGTVGPNFFNGTTPATGTWTNTRFSLPFPMTFGQATASTPLNGSMIYCSDCTIANPCAGSGTGALLKRLNGVNVCN